MLIIEFLELGLNTLPELADVNEATSNFAELVKEKKCKQVFPIDNLERVDP